MKDIIERIKKGEIREMEGNKDINLEMEITYIETKYFEKFYYYDENGNVVGKIKIGVIL